MCDIGRYQNEFVHAPERLNGIKQRNGEQFVDLPWNLGIKAIKDELIDDVNAHGGKKTVVVLSPFLTCEEAYLLARFAKQMSKHITLALGKVPVAPEGDETFKSGFTIRAERCPNRKGIEAILQHHEGQVVGWDEVVRRAEAGEYVDAYITASYPDPWIDDAEAAKFAGLKSLIVQDILPSPLARRAKLVVPGVTFAEKGGCYVNHAGLIQRTDWALRPAEGAHIDGQTFCDLLGRRGLYNPDAVLAELAETIPFFARAKDGVPEAGLNLVTGTEKKPATTALGTVTHPLPTFRSLQSPLTEIEVTT
jgi:NADH-quinone oxidoreductase subunit G